MPRSKIIFVLTGSIACYQACEVIHRLLQSGHTVRVVATPAALRFVGRATLEGLTGWSVLEQIWAMGEAIDHLHLAKWADAVVVCPATADTVIRLCDHGGDDLLAHLFAVHSDTKPWVIASAMPAEIWHESALTRAAAKLRRRGVRLIPPPDNASSVTAVSEELMAPPAAIVRELETALARPARRLRLLLTGGCPAETLGGLRLLADTDAGALGTELADALARAGHDVLLLCTREFAPATPGGEHHCYATLEQLDELLGAVLDAQDFDAVLHAAAISDFSLEPPRDESSRVADFPGCHRIDCATVQLRRHTREVERLRTWSHHPLMRVIAFNLLHDTSEAAALKSVDRLFEHAAVDGVVHRDSGKMRSGDFFPLRVFTPGRRSVGASASMAGLVAILEQVITSPRALAAPVACAREK